MIELKGKTIAFGDIHLGIKSDSLSRLMVDVNFIKYLIDYIEQNEIDNVVFLGDWFNSRESINSITLTVGFELISLLSKALKQIVFIVGNHDLESNVYHDVTSVISYSSIPNVHLVTEPTTGIVDNKAALFVPWGFNETQCDSSKKYYYIFGHLNVANNMVRYNRVIATSLSDNISEHAAINDVWNFVNYLQPNGIIISGHIHNRSEVLYKQHRILFVGSPFEITFGEVGVQHGFIVIDNDKPIEFIETKASDIPRHIYLRLSNCFDENGKLKDESFFSFLKGNIVKKIIDKNLSDNDLYQLNTILSTQDVFDFAPAEYNELQPILAETEISANSSFTLDKYFDMVIDVIDESMLTDFDLSKSELKATFLDFIEKCKSE